MESDSHKRLKRKAAGKSGQTEKKLSNGKRLDAVTNKKATEIERSGSNSGLEKAVQRLKDSRKSQKVLQVPQKDMQKAAEAMRKKRASGTVKNLSSTKRISIKKK